MDSRIQEIFAFGIRAPVPWKPEYSCRNLESHWHLESGIQVPLKKIWNPESRIPDCLGFLYTCKGIRIPESRKFLLVESRILGFGIRKTAVGIWNLTDNWNRNPSSNGKDLESSNWNPESPARNTKSMTVLDPFTHEANGFAQE